MAQQISVEAAYEVYRGKASDLFHENALLRAQVVELESRLNALQAENEQLKAQPPAAQVPQPLSCIEPDALP